MNVIRVGDRVRILEPGQPTRYGTVQAREALDDHFVYDVVCDDGAKLFAYPEKYLTRV